MFESPSGVFIFGLLSGAVLCWLLLARRQRGLEDLIRYADEIAKGNLNIEIDLSNRHQLEPIYQAFKNMLEALKSSELVFRSQTAELSRSNAELERFAYVASHDLQEPLRMVASYVQLLARRYRNKLDKDADEFIQFAVGGVNRMQTLINDLLLFSRVGSKPKEHQAVNLNTILDSAILNLQTAIEEKNARISSSPLPTVVGDEVQLIQLFQNLLANAIKFSGDNAPEIHIGSVKEDGVWKVSFKDNGIGIDQQFHQRIFQIFQRLHTQSEYPGTGIGLAICKKIIERHSGTIDVESKLGEGTTFVLTLPEMRVE